MNSPSYGLTRELKGVGFDQAIERVTEALKTEGFAVLTRIDVHQTLKTRLGVSFPEYAILGACNPSLAHGALQVEPWAGLLLPCNVVVRALENGDSAVSIASPSAIFQAVDNPNLATTIRDVETRLLGVVERI